MQRVQSVGHGVCTHGLGHIPVIKSLTAAAVSKTDVKGTADSYIATGESASSMVRTSATLDCQVAQPTHQRRPVCARDVPCAECPTGRRSMSYSLAVHIPVVATPWQQRQQRQQLSVSEVQLKSHALTRIRSTSCHAPTRVGHVHGTSGEDLLRRHHHTTFSSAVPALMLLQSWLRHSTARPATPSKQRLPQ